MLDPGERALLTGSTWRRSRTTTVAPINGPMSQPEILEATDYDACIDTTRKMEFHMASDKPGLVIRKQLLDLLRAHGEEEVHRGNVGKIIPIQKAIA